MGKAMTQPEEKQKSEYEFRHCDDYIKDKSQPMCLRKFLFVNRLPAVWKYSKWIGRGKPKPKLFADHEGKRVRVVMASRMGDVGIAKELSSDRGYYKRVYIEQLSNFAETK